MAFNLQRNPNEGGLFIMNVSRHHTSWLILCGLLALLMTAIAVLFVASSAVADVINVDEGTSVHEDDDDYTINDAIFLASERDKKVEGITIEVYHSEGELVAKGSTDRNGEFEVRDLKDDTYTWKALDGNLEIDNGTFTIRVDRQLTGSFIFFYAEDYPDDVNNFVFLATNHHSTGASGLDVRVYDDGRKTLVASATTDYEGTCFITELDNAWYEFDVLNGREVVSKGRIYSYGPDPEADSTVKGQVTDKDSGDVIPDAFVILGGKASYLAATDEDGNYQVQVISGDYTVFAAERKYEDTGSSVTVPSGGTVTQDFELDKLSEIYGKVMDSEDANPIPDAYVEADDGTDEGADTESRPDGYYELWVSPGEYDIYASHNDYEDYKAKVELKEDQELEHNIKMRKGSSSENSKIYGNVTDKDTGEAIAEARVRVYNKNKEYYTSTDEEGYYEVTCYSGHYTIEIVKDDYKTYTGEEDVGEEEEVEHNAELEPKGEENSKVYGKVTDANTSEPIEGADILLSNSDDSYKTQTDEGGDYEITCRSGDYDIEVHAENYESHYGELSVAEEEEKQYDVELEPKGEENSRVYGTVTDADTGEPLKDARVRMYDSENSYYATTDDRGEYEIKCRSGDYEIQISKSGYKTHSGQVSVEENDEVEYNAKLEKEGEETTLEGYITEGSGRGEGDPVEGATVKLSDGNREYTATTDENGYYYMKCEEGDYTIDITHKDYEKHENDIYIAEGRNQYDAELTPVARGRMYGKVTDKETGDPLEDTKVRLRDKDSGKEYTEYTDKEGYYSLEVPAGDYDILVHQTDYVDVEDEVTIEKDDEIERDYELEKEIREGEVWGTVKDDAANEGIEGVTLTYEMDESRGDTYDTSTDEYGDYDIDLPEGDYNVSVEHEDYKTIYSKVTVVGDGSVEKNYRMDPKEGKIYGVVADKDSGDPIKDATITAEEKESRGGEPYSNSTTTDRDGEYEMNLPPGDYTITIEHDEYIKLWDNITIEKEDEKEQDYDIEARSKEGTVYGKITDKDTGDPIKGALVSLDTDTGRGTGSGHTTVVTTDENGEYEISDAPGDYALTVEEDGYVTVEDTVTLEYKKRVEKNYALEKLPDKKLKIDTDAPSTMKSGEAVNILISVVSEESSRGAGVAGVSLTLSVDGPASLNRLTGKTDSNGELIIKLTADELDEDAKITLNITAEKDDYLPDSYEKEITITAPRTEVVGPETGDLGSGASYSITAGIIGDGEIDIEASSSPDPEDDKNIGIFLDISFDDDGGDAEFEWVYIEIYYGDIPNGLSENKLKIYYWDDDYDEWVEAENAGVDTVNQLVWANVTHLTIFAPRDETGSIIKNYGVELTGEEEATVKAGEVASYSLTIENTGETTDSYVIEVTGASEDWGSLEIEDVTLDEGDHETFTVTVTVPEETPAGSYTLKIKATSLGDNDVEDTITLRVIIESEADGSDDTPGFILGIFVASLAVVAVLRKRR